MADRVLTVRQGAHQFPPDCEVYRQNGGGWIYQVYLGGYPAVAKRVATFSPDLHHGEVYVEMAESGAWPVPYPLAPPLDRVLLVHKLSQEGSGLLVHACAIVHQGQSYVLAGESGAGKSTMAVLWGVETGARVLGEECIAIRSRDGGFTAHGTPWIGNTGLYAPEGAPLGAIYFLRHAPQNCLMPLPPETGVQRLLARSFLAVYDRAAAARGLDLAIKLAYTVPMFEYGFVPDSSAVQVLADSFAHG
ncbi:MAG: hypothetical protein JXA93_19780 [Anaerolineae bacterium]|nr:hypothetical protein [Anaerolineae bacterium]